MRTESLASSQSYRSVDAGTWCKEALMSTFLDSFHKPHSSFPVLHKVGIFYTTSNENELEVVTSGINLS